MAIQANQPRYPQNQHPTFHLEMSGRTLFLAVILAGLTGLTLFYLGMVTGMGMRTPGSDPQIAGEDDAKPGQKETPGDAPGQSPGQGTIETGGAAKPSDTDLTFYRNLKSENAVVDDLKKNQDQAAKETADLLNRSQRELKTEEETISHPLVANPPPSGAKPATTKPAPAPAGERFTVQVFSSTSRDKANDLISRLRKQGFSAYLNQFQDNKKHTWYRVRVGKVEKAEAEKLKIRLTKEAGLKAPKVQKL